jgi:hypothetical protein
MLRRYLTKLVAYAARKVTESRPPDFMVGDPNDPYMLRWWWIPRNRYFNIYIHKFLKDDDDRAKHDHPWWSYSLMCEGWLVEYHGPGDDWNMVESGDWVYRAAEYQHRLVVPNQETIPLTVFITGPVKRHWGFYCPQGWRHWRDFVGAEKGQVGRGCGEMETFNDEGILNEFHCRKCGETDIMSHHNSESLCRRCL